MPTLSCAPLFSRESPREQLEKRRRNHRHFDRMRKGVEIVNKLGLHAQSASEFVRA
jgi:hypothetical protein